MRHLRGEGDTAPVQMAAVLIGLVFVVIGVLGFVPGVTTGYDTLALPHDSQAELFGLFEVSILHNIVHLVFGVIGVAASRSIAASALFLVLGGIAYLVLWIYGLIVDDLSGADFLPTNAADDWLHFGLGIAMLAIFFATPRIGTTRATDPHRPHSPIE
ncbi:DUF4383 domain-containing protein [Rhodococcus sp. PvR099]|jgi:hypothetical protein|uniref:DUF4383 domain-containing protein n=2 Tax=Rhodococcus TaxID=1827 RepID=UPI000BD7144C|nr:DUF4383 domain-containing protein [Rhodococcus sp. PvR099]PTR42978.1 uncharacterized protein DUF4383 [Rhodococcus sp. OK611]SNX91313.1 protein of unknown function [Rhodococcus sp. OK270]